MFVTLLKFSENRSAAPEFMTAHNDWIAQGFSDGVFLAVGSLHPEAGGAILAHGESRETHQARIQKDPFVVENVVTPETYEIDLKRTTPGLDFLKVPA